MKARVLVEGSAQGRLLRFTQDISFWGGVDPQNGRVIDTRHPQWGQVVTGRILALGQSIGSSSGSSILLEMLVQDTHPAGIILGVPDQILTLGSVVGREMGLGHIPVVALDAGCFGALPEDLRINEDGVIEPCRARP